METSPESNVQPALSQDSQRIERQIAIIESHIKSIRMKLKGLEAGDEAVIRSLGLTKDGHSSRYLSLDEAALNEALEISKRMLARFKEKRAKRFS
mgnify:CR=1 FL=1